MTGIWESMSNTIRETVQLLSERPRKRSEVANERAHRKLDHEMCERGIDSLDDIDRLMRNGGGNGHHKSTP